VGGYVLQHWVKHLADAILRDEELTLEEMRERGRYRRVKHESQNHLRSRFCSISVDREGLKQLREDVRRAERLFGDRVRRTGSRDICA
jgi:hypothetical protein